VLRNVLRCSTQRRQVAAWEALRWQGHCQRPDPVANGKGLSRGSATSRSPSEAALVVQLWKSALRQKIGDVEKALRASAEAAEQALGAEPSERSPCDFSLLPEEGSESTPVASPEIAVRRPTNDKVLFPQHFHASGQVLVPAVPRLQLGVKPDADLGAPPARPVRSSIAPEVRESLDPSSESCKANEGSIGQSDSDEEDDEEPETEVFEARTSEAPERSKPSERPVPVLRLSMIQ
ncbi:unnamed protein product, partial [Polarella glacialis]